MPRHRVPARAPLRAGRAALVAIAVAAAVSGCAGGDRGNDLNGFARTPPLRADGLTLPDVTSGGAPTAFRARAHGLLLVYFGYTSCPDVCPTTLADVRLAIGRLAPAQRGRVGVAMVTVDPGRDTPTVLRRYLGHYSPHWHGLRTSDPAALRRAERAFRARHRLGPKGRHGGYEVSHTAETYAVDGRGVVRVEWPFGTSAAAMAQDLATLLAARAA